MLTLIAFLFLTFWIVTLAGTILWILVLLFIRLIKSLRYLLDE